MSSHSLTPEFEALVRSALGEFEPRALAAEIKKLSDFYIENPGEPTPWQESFAAPAYTAYFQTLNFVRLRAAFAEVIRFLPSDSVEQIWDFGSGLGTTHWMLEGQSHFSPREFFGSESSGEALGLYRSMLQKASPRWEMKFASPAKRKALGIYSYSFLEIAPTLEELKEFDHLLIVEPSTSECGRRLMEWRAKLIAEGFTPLAPCTHSAACPLLVHSTRDWCHHRIHFSPPEWYSQVEEFLPMKNRTLTFSYLLMSRTVQDTVWRGAARVIGDTLEENGKTRQLVCRGTEREFFSWLHRNGEPPHIPHGSLVAVVGSCEVKGNELRVGDVEWTE